MLLAAAIRDRLRTQVPALGQRVLGAGDFAALVARSQLPQVTPAAAVLPLGLRGGETAADYSRFRQIVTRRVAVVLVVRLPDQVGARAPDDIEALAEAVVAALAGWTPAETTPGVLRLEAGELRSVAGGTLVYDLTFALHDAVETP